MTIYVISDSSVTTPIAQDSWLQDSLALLPGITRAVAEQELMNSAREFYRKSFAWRHMILDQDLQLGIDPGDDSRARYSLLTSHATADVQSVIGVAYKGRWLGVSRIRPVIYGDMLGTPTSYYIADAPDKLELYPDAEAVEADVLTFEVALAPRVSSTTLPHLAQHLHYDAIRNGFLARVYAHPNKPYTSPSLAESTRKTFNSEIAKYRAEAKTGYNNAQSWVYPRGWSPSGR